MTSPGRAAFIALFFLSCASGCAPQRPSEPQPRPACFTGAGAIDIPSPVAPAARGAAQEETVGIGGLGLVGGTGSPVKEGTVGLGSPASALTVIPGQPLFHGAIERDDLRRTVRRHLQELATCPDTSTTPDHRRSGGRVVVDFVIDPQGRVERSSIRSSTVGDRQVDACVGQRACRWTFAAPRDGGRAVVSYPLVFAPPETGN